ncbi:MAG: nucleoside deaminase [Alphaproteobacteria bacterium]|nr:nucleoside deaminase [Alphaproteobacteria bacterium]MBR1757024.1 nucleoside deaminase [Alphaproteobacteria bacterium]
MNKEEYMQIALQLARQAAAEDEVPVAALVVDSSSGEIVAEAYNQSAHGTDSTAHAEILAIRRACDKRGSTRLWDLDMYVTLEPCTMCAAAISFARIRNLYFGATDEKGGAVVNGVKFYDSPTCHHRPNVEYGICANACGQLLKDFFRQKRG